MNTPIKLLSATALMLSLAACSKSIPAENAMTGDIAMNDMAANDMTANGSTVNDSAGNAAAADLNMAAGAATGQTFANDAAVSDAFEIASSKLAATKASSAAVKKFAAEMVSAHTASTTKLMKAAATATPAITPDPTLPADKQATIDALSKLSGTDFDKAYAAAQVSAHEETLAKVKGYAETGDVAPLKAVATELVPIVSTHLDMAKKL